MFFVLFKIQLAVTGKALIQHCFADFYRIGTEKRPS
jgi:hypothetical protein